MSDTKWFRKLVKLAFYVTHGKATRHQYAVWPSLALPEGAKPMWRGKPIAAQFVRSLPEGLPEITIVGSGPSIKTQNMEKLPDGTAVLVNGAISLSARVRPLAIACEDERFVTRHPAIFKDAPRDCIWMLSPSVMRCLLEQDATALDGLTVLPLTDLLKPPHGPRRKMNDAGLASFVRRNDHAGLSRAPDVGVIPVGTIAFSVLQHALAASPAQIGLAGVDLSNANTPRFNETADNTAFSGIVAALDRILAHFSLALEEANEKEIKIECYSPVSALCGIDYPYSDRLS